MQTSFISIIAILISANGVHRPHSLFIGTEVDKLNGSFGRSEINQLEKLPHGDYESKLNGNGKKITKGGRKEPREILKVIFCEIFPTIRNRRHSEFNIDNIIAVFMNMERF